jgi:hypothetical protein
MIIILVTLTILLILSIGVNIALSILVKNSFKKISIYEQEILKSDEFILNIRENILTSLGTMREIDKQGVFSSRVSEKGLFESDDMVGTIFKELVQTVEELNINIEKINEKK